MVDLACTRRIAEEHAARNALQGTAAGCFDTCWGASHDLATALRRGDLTCHLAMLKGWRGADMLPAVGNHEEWRRMGRRQWTHWVVVVGPLYIDVTARQFDPALGHPQFDTLKSLRERWDVIDGVETIPWTPGDFLEHAKDARHG